MRTRSFIALAAVVLLAPGCAGLSKKKNGPAKVDDLLGRVEHVQVEALLSREHAHGAYDALSALAAPGFQGDAVMAYEHLVEAVEQSIAQAEAFSASLPPMKEAANELFVQWTTNLEAFGGTSMREKSQARMEEARARYEGVLSTAVAAKIAFDAYNSDLRDQALFLENDFNATSLAVISAELTGLEGRGVELSRRLDACAHATRVYVESDALPGPLQGADEVTVVPAPRDTQSLRAQTTPSAASGVSGSPGAPAPGASAEGF